MNPFISAPNDVELHDAGWVDVGGKVFVTLLPLWDARVSLFARMGHGPAADLLRRSRLRLPTVEEWSALHQMALHIDPFTLPTGNMIIDAGVPRPWMNERGHDTPRMARYRAGNMRSLDWCELHDDEVTRRMGAAGWNGQPIANAGKHWATQHGVNVLTGWWDKRGHPLQMASRFHLGEPHYTDYATTTHAACDGNPPPYLRAPRWTLEEMSRVTPLSPPTLRGGDIFAHDIGLRCVYWMGYQSGLDISEIPGLKHDERITEYSLHCRRGGTFLGVSGDGRPMWDGGVPLPLTRDEDPWCAAITSAALLASLQPGEQPPHGLRVAVRELVEDARKAGTLRPKGWAPWPGSLAIEGRRGESPLHAGRGHVRRVVQVDHAQYFGIGGNESNRIVRAWHPLDDAVAWIDCSAGGDVTLVG